jgi:FlgD Ig-like domain
VRFDFLSLVFPEAAMLRRPLFFAGWLITLALGAAAPAVADWPHDPYSGNLLVCGAANGQAATASIPDGAGGVIITWIDFRGGVDNDVYAQRVSAAGVPLWAANGVLLCNATGDQINPAITSDGAGGAIISWGDARSGTYDIYAQHINSLGALQWGATGAAVCTFAANQVTSQIVSDGAGGAIIVWGDSRPGATQDIYAQRVNFAGAAQWTANGVAVCNAANDQGAARIVSDGAGGAIIAWQDLRGAAADIYAQRLSSAGTVLWTVNGTGISTATNSQEAPVLCGDGANGAIIAWQDFRNGASYDIYAQHVNSAGSALWGSNGIPICAAASSQTSPSIDTDGMGGAIIGWQDFRGGATYDIYAQRVTSGGASLWTVDGAAVSTGVGDQTAPLVLSDNANGAILCWMDTRFSTNTDLFAQRLTPTGATQWVSGGATISGAAGSQVTPCISSDGAGGAIVAWQDSRSTGAYDIYAQKIEFYGQLGNPNPAAAGVHDVPHDQGGIVKVGWTASYLDAAPTFGITEYRLWRSAPPNLMAERETKARRVSANPDEAVQHGMWFTHAFGAQQYLWEYVGTTPAGQLPGYSVLTATAGDSVGAGNPATAFMVEARTGTSLSSAHWYSSPDSGYSVDNLPPAAPAPFTGAFVSGSIYLHWNRNSEGDLAGYRVYRGTTPGFVTDGSSLLAAVPDTGYSGTSFASAYYKLTAIDAHGNESLVASLAPTGVAAVGDPTLERAFFALASRNPMVAGSAALRFGVTRGGRVTLALYDASGRRVRALLNDSRAPGTYELAWDGRDESGGAAAPGLYFARIDAPGLRATVRIVRTE